MPSTFQTTFDATVVPELDTTFGVMALYSRGAAQVSMVVMIDPGTSASMGQDGFVFEKRILQILIRSSRLILNGIETLPERGDKLQFTARGINHQYELGTDAGAPIFEWDRAHTGYTVTGTKVKS